MFVLVLFSVASLFLMVRRRISAMSKGEINPAYFKVYNSNEHKVPESLSQADRHFVNLFEIPVLFYAGCLAAMVLPTSSFLTNVFAWAYVLLRFVHSYIHLTTNNTKARALAFVLSVFAVLLLWGHLAILVASL